MGKQVVKLGIIAGDHAGIGPEIVVKALIKRRCSYVPVLIGNLKYFGRYASDIDVENLTEGYPLKHVLVNHQTDCIQKIYYKEIPVSANTVINPGEISAASGKLM